ncbi:MAG: alpha/beta hydrolase, partial [Nesterenkonia sp.]|nr:alpha/beta hydrolase [Nesterenkonia sp.]
PERLRRLDVPCQLLAWTDDAAHPLSTAEELHRLLPDSTLEVAETPEQLRTWPRRTAEFMARHGAGDRTGPTGRRS